MPTDERSIQNASNDIDLGFYTSLDAAAEANTVPKSTLGHRRAGRPSHAQVSRKNQRLSNEEEKVVMQWLRDMQKQNLYLSYPKMRDLITELLKNKDIQRPLGQYYIIYFLSCHTEFKIDKSRTMDIKQLFVFDSEIVTKFFDEFERLYDIYKIEIEDIYNMNEIGFQINQIQVQFVIYDSALERSTVSDTGNMKWISIIEYINHNDILKPYMIFDGKFPEEN